MMGKNILILNGAARKQGRTAELVQAFSDGARSAGHVVTEFYLDGLTIHSCRGCLHAGTDPNSPCTQKDDMDQIYRAFAACDVVVFASPVYFWTITGKLKTVADRLYASLECLGYNGFRRESVLLMTADGSEYSQAQTWYHTYERNLHWHSLGEILGKGRTKEAYRLGETI